ncbi:Peptidoglycan O-acetyltransferase [Sinobacterium norvegicum]|uniref:Probable alginate O-acetylase AlgI n=1 Tax=Sinobacterium norvegicum TaxID=1641715 RepID=A0ABM9AGG1_9GAMM|nr:MBOAT family O-acyltransferase [Sinobacterium norvegicum]CAH0992284.1 Peptidoglycan O-acetyltransferase [Sinobacterium norvegicum]
MINTFEFWLALFLGACVYWLIPLNKRTWFLSTLSAAYICYLDTVSGLSLILASGALKTLLDYQGANSRVLIPIRWIVIGLTIWLAAFKALPVILENIFNESMFANLAVPIGISYYVFRLIHYCVERNRGHFSELSYAEYYSWLLLFPIFTAGPIEQLEHFRKQKSDTYHSIFVVEGLTRIFHGLIKKFVFADLIVRQYLMNGATVTSTLENLSTISTAEAWVFFILLFVYFYLEFAAYSDIAIGGSRLFGVKIVENFNWPILAKNMSEFWKRWHMSLAAFCQRYVYMPIIARTRNPYYAILFTFLTMGLWHAVNINYILWGLFHGAGVATVLTWNKFKRQRGWPSQLPGPLAYLGIPVTLAYVSFGGVFAGTNGMGVAPALSLAAKLLGL